MMGGTSSQAKANEEAQTNFFNQMVAQQNETFGQQQELLTQIKAVAAPILGCWSQPVRFLGGGRRSAAC